MRQPGSVLSQVTAQGLPSVEYDLFLAHGRGDLTIEEYYTENARLTGEKTSEYVPRPYLPLTQSLRTYCDGRVYGSMPYDQQTAHHLGIWVQQIHKSKEMNDHDMSHLLWAIERCAKAQLKSHVDSIEAKVMEYITLQFPFDQFELAMKAKAKDASEREGRVRQ
jgi:hypothetical protein